MMKRSIEFGFSQADLENLATFIAALNRAGVPFTLRRDNIAIEITIGHGFWNSFIFLLTLPNSSDSLNPWRNSPSLKRRRWPLSARSPTFRVPPLFSKARYVFHGSASTRIERRIENSPIVQWIKINSFPITMQSAFVLPRLSFGKTWEFGGTNFALFKPVCKPNLSNSTFKRCKARLSEWKRLMNF